MPPIGSVAPVATTPSHPDSNRQGRWPLVAVVLIPLLFLAPFVNKSFHIDDPIFLYTAKRIVEHPIDFYGFEINWRTSPQPMHVESQNPPGLSYLLAPIGALFGWGEFPMHLATALMASACALGIYLLSKRFTRHPAFATAIAVLSPGFLVSANTVMSDVPMLMFYVWAVYFWLRGLESPRRHGLLLAALLLGVAATLTKYFGLSVFPLLFAYALAREKRLGTWAIHFVVPALLLLGYQALTYSLYGRSHLGFSAGHTLAANQFISFSAPFRRAELANVFVGASAFVVLFLTPRLWSWKGTLISVSAIVALSLLPTFEKLLHGGFLTPPDSIAYSFRLQAALWTVAGVQAFVLAIQDVRVHRDEKALLLFFWFMGTWIFGAFVNHLINVRTLLPLLPAVGILVSRRIERDAAPSSLWNSACMVPAIALSVWAMIADAELARAYRDAAHRILTTTESTREEVHFTGHWGFQYYMESKGATSLASLRSETRTSSYFDLDRGDILVVPSVPGSRSILAPPLVEELEMFDVPLGSGMAIMDQVRGAGFYSHQHGPLPFVLDSPTPLRFTIYRVTTANPDAPY